jgi:CRISPR-associated protein Csd2
VKNRYDIVYLFDITNGNPNGDPDAGNLPRVDPETGIGLVSDVCLKRKMRNYTGLVRGDQPGHRIYVEEDAVLSERHREAYVAVRPGDKNVAKADELYPDPKKPEEAQSIVKFMCDNFWDIRTFGAMMALDINARQVRGPVQIAFAKSVEPIRPLEITITRMAAANQKDLDEKRKRISEKRGGDGDIRVDQRTIGNKYIVPYGLYRAHIYVNACLAEKTGFSESDLALIFDALKICSSTTDQPHAPK